MERYECITLWEDYVTEFDIPYFLRYQEFIVQAHKYPDGSLCLSSRAWRFDGKLDGGWVSVAIRTPEVWEDGNE